MIVGCSIVLVMMVDGSIVLAVIIGGSVLLVMVQGGCHPPNNVLTIVEDGSIVLAVVKGGPVALVKIGGGSIVLVIVTSSPSQGKFTGDTSLNLSYRALSWLCGAVMLKFLLPIE